MVDRQKIETNIAPNFFCFLALRDVNNYLIFTRVCNAMTFDMQWHYVIGIPRDLFFNIAGKVKLFIFFSSTTVKVRWLLKSVRAREQKKLCAMLTSIF